MKVKTLLSGEIEFDPSQVEVIRSKPNSIARGKCYIADNKHGFLYEISSETHDAIKRGLKEMEMENEPS